MIPLIAALLLTAQDGLSYQGPALDRLSADAYAIYLDRLLAGPVLVLEGEGPDGDFQSIRTERCVSRITGRGQIDQKARSWTIDWKSVNRVGRDVPYFFAVSKKGGGMLAFLTSGEAARTPVQQADMLSIMAAYQAATLLHLACDPAARSRYPDLATSAGEQR